MKKQLKLGLSLALAAFLVAGCTDDNTTEPVAQQPAQPANAQAQAFTQVEQLARPGINEGLLFTNALLNTYNSVTPAFVAQNLATATQPGNPLQPIAVEASAVLAALGNNEARRNALLGAFLPDVMRIDTTLNFTPRNDGVETSAYGSQLNNALSPVAGRKLTDDVIDITLSVLSNGAVTSDGVPYYRPIGNTNPNIGHSNLNGQTVQFGPATFPYLAPPQ